MPWFRRSPPGPGAGPAGAGTPPGPQLNPQQQQGDVEAIERGGLPSEALRRLKARSDTGGLFTSDLDVGEFAAALRDGWRPLGLVMGSSVFRVSWRASLSALQYTYGLPLGGGFGGPAAIEIEPLSRAARDCRRNALHRLELEVEALGGHGAVGVRLRRSSWDWGTGLAEFTAVGTAVRLADAPPLPHTFVGALSGTEAHKLLHAGYAPQAVVGGACVVYVSGMEAAMAGLNYANTPLGETSRAIAEARDLAVRRLREEAQGLAADGVVGVEVEVHDEPVEMQAPDRTDHLIEVFALGTAVVAFRRGSRVPSVRAAVDLSD